MKTINADWYDYPRYYDLAMRGDTKLECDFVDAVARRFLKLDRLDVLEPGCGSGRLTAELASRGHRPTGFDLNSTAVSFAERRLKRRRLNGVAKVADMADFDLGERFDLAFNPCNTFRHLLDDRTVQSHFAAIRRHLRPRGIYVLGLHLLPDDADWRAFERWTERSGDLSITTTLTVARRSLKRRTETLKVVLRVESPRPLERGSTRRSIRLRSFMELRTYSPAEMRALIRSIPGFKLEGSYDFWMNLDEPQPLDDRISDCVLIFRRV